MKKTKQQLGFVHLHLLIFGVIFAGVGGLALYRTFAYSSSGNSNGRYPPIWVTVTAYPKNISRFQKTHIQINSNANKCSFDFGGASLVDDFNPPKGYDLSPTKTTTYRALCSWNSRIAPANSSRFGSVTVNVL